jgi:hypothetical protein
MADSGIRIRALNASGDAHARCVKRKDAADFGIIEIAALVRVDEAFERSIYFHCLHARSCFNPLLSPCPTSHG